MPRSFEIVPPRPRPGGARRSKKIGSPSVSRERTNRCNHTACAALHAERCIQWWCGPLAAGRGTPFDSLTMNFGSGCDARFHTGIDPSIRSNRSTQAELRYVPDAAFQSGDSSHKRIFLEQYLYTDTPRNIDCTTTGLIAGMSRPRDSSQLAASDQN